MIRLETVTGKNLDEILALRVRQDQKDFVAPNERSIIEAYIALTRHGRAFPFGIYDEDQPVGFCMIGYGTDDDWDDAPAVAKDSYNIWRLMIDERYQGRGFGKEAMKLILSFIGTAPCGPADLCWLSYEPENAAAKALYASFGFRETGEWDGDEVIAVRQLSAPAPDVRPVTEEDRAFWMGLDPHLDEAEFAGKVRDGRGYVLTADGTPAGILRWSLFWDSIPFCNMLYIRKGERGRGFGRALMAFWEKDLRKRGYRLAMTSTQSDEDGQRFYRRLGYQDCGLLTLPFPGFEQPAELILAKSLQDERKEAE